MEVPVKWEQLEWETVRPGVKRKVFQGIGCTVSLNHIEPGNQPNIHAHLHEQVVYVLQGQAQFTIDSEKADVSAGTILTVPPNVLHSVKVVGSETFVNIDVFIPKRIEYKESRKMA